MRIAHIVPTSMLRLVERHDYHLVLADLVVNNWIYADFYRKQRERGAYVILDNGAYEFGRTPSVDTLLEAAEFIHPQEIVLPDSMYGPDCALESVEMSLEGRERLWEAGYHKFMAVPHGNTLQEWNWSLNQLRSLVGVRCIGIAEKDALKLVKGGRRSQLVELIPKRMPIHLLGMMEDMSDVIDPKTRRRIRGVDGSKMMVWGLHEQAVYPTDSPLPPYPGRPGNFFDLPMVTFEQWTITAHNMHRWTVFAESR